MITPSFSPTATERVLPRMALDFTTGVLDSRVTVTRALNTATAIGSNGLLAIVNANLPRFDYDPATLAPKGLLIEESRTNVLLYSQDMANAAWAKNWGGGVTASANQAAGPDGAQNLARVTSSGVGGAAYQFFTLPGSTAYSISIFVRQGTATTSKLEIFNSILATISSVTFTWTAGVPSTSATSGSPTNITYQNFGGGLYRVSYTFTTHVAGDTYILFLPDNTAGLGTSLAGYVQLEAGAFATSYIPTTTTSLTRNADAVSMTGTNFSSWYTPNSSLFFTSTLGGYNSATHNCAGSFSNNANSQYLDYRLHDRFTGTVRMAGSAGQLIQLQGPLLNTRYKVGTTNNNTVRLAGAMAGNAVVASATAGTFAGAEKLNIGSRFDGALDYLNGWAVSVYSYSLTLTDAELRAFSK